MGPAGGSGAEGAGGACSVCGAGAAGAGPEPYGPLCAPEPGCASAPEPRPEFGAAGPVPVPEPVAGEAPRSCDEPSRGASRRPWMLPPSFGAGAGFGAGGDVSTWGVFFEDESPSGDVAGEESQRRKPPQESQKDWPSWRAGVPQSGQVAAGASDMVGSLRGSGC